MIAAFAASTAVAEAGSILKLTATPLANAPSMTMMTCADCPAALPAQKDKKRPSVGPIQTQAELTNFYGKKAVRRTGAWMGGSPVTFVSLSPVWISEEEMMLVGQPSTPAKTDGVDFHATTSAVGTQPSADALKPAEVSPAQPNVQPDFNGYQLRPSI